MKKITSKLPKTKKCDYCKCMSCANKDHNNNQGRFKKGEKNPNWKGGRFKQIYWWIKIDINSPYINMASRYGSGDSYYMLEHRFIMAKSLGRCLDTKELVHHLNGIKEDNRINNLAIVSRKSHDTKSYIKSLQKRIRELEKERSK